MGEEATPPEWDEIVETTGLNLEQAGFKIIIILQMYLYKQI